VTEFDGPVLAVIACPPAACAFAEDAYVGSMDLLDPKLDVVFKMLFADRQNRRLLESLLTAVLRPPSPIANITVLDPDLPKDLASDRGVRLDVLVELADGTLVDVEMECDARRAHGERWLYQWARLFGGRLRRGDKYEKLEPVVCIVFLDARTESRRFHSVYEAREVHDHSQLCDALAVHVVELPRVEQATIEGEPLDLQRWARFLRVDDERALESLASETPIMAEAKHALEILSREPSAQRIAEMRREAEIARRLDRAEDLAQGRAEGRAEGAVQNARRNIAKLCVNLGIELAGVRLAQLESWDEKQLDAAFDSLLNRRAWPTDLNE